MTGFNPSLPRNLSGLFGPGLVRSDAISRPGIRPSSRLVPVEAAFDIPLGSDGRGIIVSNPMQAGPDGLHIVNAMLDDSEIRRALLYWDAIVWPVNNVVKISDDHDARFLSDEGVMFRPEFILEPNGFSSDLAGEYVAKSYLDSFEELERRAPGQWALSSGDTSIMLKGEPYVEGRGVLAELTRAIPLPERSVPFSEILEFKLRHGGELVELRNAIEGMYQDWVNSEDQAHQLRLSISRVDAAANRVIRIARASPMSFSLSSWQISFSATAGSVVSAILGFKMSELSGLDLVTSTLAGLGAAVPSTLSFSRSLGNTSIGAELQAFNYVASLHRESL